MGKENYSLSDHLIYNLTFLILHLQWNWKSSESTDDNVLYIMTNRIFAIFFISDNHQGLVQSEVMLKFCSIHNYARWEIDVQTPK